MAGALMTRNEVALLIGFAARDMRLDDLVKCFSGFPHHPENHARGMSVCFQRAGLCLVDLIYFYIFHVSNLSFAVCGT